MSHIHTTILLIASLAVLLGFVKTDPEVGWTLLSFSGVSFAATEIGRKRKSKAKPKIK